MQVRRGFMVLASVLVGVLLVGGCSTTDDDPTRIAAPESPGVAVGHPDPGAPGPSCGDIALADAPDRSISWHDYIRWDDGVYLGRSGVPPFWRGQGLGERIGEVSCTRANSLTPVEHVPRHGEAAHVEAGSEVRAVQGVPTRRAVAVVVDGQPRVYVRDRAQTQQLLADEPAADEPTTDEPDADRTDTATGASLALDADAPMAFRDRDRLPSCGVVDLWTMGAELRGYGKEPAVRCLFAARGSASGAELVHRSSNGHGSEIVSYFRALPGSTRVELFHDNTGDSYGKQVWSHIECADLTRRTLQVEDCGRRTVLDLGA